MYVLFTLAFTVLIPITLTMLSVENRFHYITVQEGCRVGHHQLLAVTLPGLLPEGHGADRRDRIDRR